MKPTGFRQSSRPLLARVVATLLVPAVTLVSVPATAGPLGTTTPSIAPAVKVNRIVPTVRPVPLRPSFSAEPTDREIFRARIFEEPLIPVGGATTPEENRALAGAIKAYVSAGDRLDLSPFETFLWDHQTTAWRPSLRLGMGIAYLRAGRFTHAAAGLQEAWETAKRLSDATSRAVADRALGELANLRMQFTQVTEAQLLLRDAEGRSMRGSAIEKLEAARSQLAMRDETPDLIHPTGAVALARILAWQQHDRYRRDPRLAGFRAPRYGATLTQIEALAQEVGLNLRMAYLADKSAPIEVPAVVHLDMGHYAAVLDRDGAGTRYLLDDPSVGAIWVTRRALLEEASGYFLIPGGELPPGWRPVQEADGDSILGRCTGIANESDTTKEDDCEGENCSCSSHGMATYSFHALTVNLSITDRPVGYAPPRGPRVTFEVTYNHKEAGQPELFTYSNLGPRWTFDQQSFIEDDNLEALYLHPRGGGREFYSGFDGQTYAPHYKSQNVVVRVQADPVVWEVRHPDGSVDVYAQPDCAVCSGRRVFMTQSKDPAGNTVTYTYDDNLRIVAITDAIGQVTTLSYELSQDPYKITRVTDPFGRFASFDYDAARNLVRITDVLGMTSEFEYSGAGAERADFITAMTTPYGRTTFRQSVVSGGLNTFLEATDPLGGTERIAYDDHEAYVPAGQQTPAADDPALVPAGFAPDNHDLNIGQTHYWDKRTMALYGPDYRKAEAIVWVTDLEPGRPRAAAVKQSEKRALENRVWYTYNGETRGYTYGHYRGPLARPNKVARVLDDGTSQVYRYEYNAIGKVIRVTDPLGRTRTYDYDANGIDLSDLKRINGQDLETISRYTYNDKHQPLTLTDARGAVTSYTYNAAGQVLSVTTPPAQGHTEGATTTFTYGTSGYLQQVSGPVPGATTSFTYDDYGRKRTSTDAAGLTLTYDYDALDRVTKVAYPDMTYEETVYSRLDPEKRRDRLGRWTQTFHDALRRPVATTDAAGGTTQYQYGAAGCGACSGGGDRLTRLIDANGNATTWEYDLQGRVTQETRADASAETYTYETTTSRLKERTDRKGVTTTFEYFLDGKLKRKSYSDATPAVNYTYDPVDGLMLTAANGTDTLTWTYDSLDRVSSEASAKNASTIAYTHDDAGNRTAISLDGVPHVTYGYDQQSRLTSITRGSNVFGFEYDTASRRTSMTYPNGVVTSYGYDGESRLTSMGASLGATAITSFSYVLDAVGNRTRKTTLDWAEDYRYDDLDRLVSADRSSGTPSRWRFTYDRVGNRTTDQTDDATMGATFNNLNELESRQAGGVLAFKGTTSEPAAVTVAGKAAQTASDNTFASQAAVGAGTADVAVEAADASGNVRTNTYRVSTSGTGATYTYDPNGNLAQKVEGSDTWTYTWNAEKQLTKVERNGSEVARFAYDPLGARVEKMAGGVTTTYTYDGWDVVREFRGTSTLKYIDNLATDEPLAREDGSGGLNYYHADGLGSIVKRTNQGGIAVHEYVYDAWGNIESGTGEPGPAFTGREWDPEIGLYYYRTRHYDPKIGRFVSEDTIGLDGGDPNYYTYVGDEPVNWIDPTGKMAAAAAPALCAAGPPGWVLAVVLVVATGAAAYQAFSKAAKDAADEEARERKFEEEHRRRPQTAAEKKAEREKKKAFPDEPRPEDTYDDIRKAQEANRKGGRDKIESIDKTAKKVGR